MKNLTYKKAVNRLEGTTDTGDYLEIVPGKKLVIEVHREGKDMIEIPLAEVLELGIQAFLAREFKRPNHNYQGAVV